MIKQSTWDVATFAAIHYSCRDIRVVGTSEEQHDERLSQVMIVLWLFYNFLRLLF